jgi:hypothetical protein
MEVWNWISFIIGFLFGLLAMTILVWIAYTVKTLAFAYCPSQQKACFSSDYFNDPGDALADGANLDDILFLTDGTMKYRRVKRTPDCTPQSDQVVTIANPQICLFTITGQDRLGKSIGFNNPRYLVNTGTITEVLDTTSNCQPVDPTISGRPVLAWEPSSLRRN